ncbi:MAG: peptidylprolyl isomerase [Planctomycetes bacterium]|nr:peptidylprolyl isomerase [Planctomycetota bacterium]
MNATSISLAAALAIWVTSACSTPKATDSGRRADVVPGATPVVPEESRATPEHPSAAPAVPAERALDELRVLEDARHPSVANFATHADAPVRARAARALGRVLTSELGPLVKLLDDGDANVRAEAAFALGMRGDKSAFDALIARTKAEHESDGLVRARAVEAASKLDAPERREEVLAALADADPRVRLEAAQGAARWSTKEPNATKVDRTLVAHLEKETDANVITYALFALDRRKSADAVTVFQRFATSLDPRQRIFAVRGLVALVAAGSLNMLDATTTSAILLARTDDHDWRVICEAVPIFKTSVDEEHTPGNPLSNTNANVRYSTWKVVGEWIATTRDTLTLLSAWAWIVHEGSGALVDYEASPFVWAAGREAQLRIYARLMKDSEDLVPRQRPYETLLSTQPLSEDDPIALAGIARGLAWAPSALFDRLIPTYLRHPNVIVASAAIEALVDQLRPEYREVLHELLYHPDNGLRLAALGTLDSQPDASDLEHVAWAFDHSTGDIAPEVRFNALKLAAKIAAKVGAKVGGVDAVALLERGLIAPEPYVRSVARAELAKLSPEKLALFDADPTKHAPVTPIAAIELPRYERHPIVDVVTNRGTMRFELFPDEAPYHVHNFLTLAERGYYDGLGFHRVVPDFVIQGGDYRGDGNGGTTFRVKANARELHARGEPIPQDSLRHEIGPRKYVRGSLGMPRNDDLDSGGSQFFVTHRETPHLDGRYTIFGELREGFDALDTIEVGDRIERVTIVDRGR